MKTYFLFVLAFFCSSLNFICNGAAANDQVSKAVELNNNCNVALSKFLFDISKYFKSNLEEDLDLALTSLEKLLNSSDELTKKLNIETVSTSSIKLLIYNRRICKIALKIEEANESNKILILENIKLCNEKLLQYLNRFNVYICYLNTPIKA